MDISNRKRVAVIGAGPSGIFVLRRLSANPDFHLKCFEKNDTIGGQWCYTDKTVDDFGRPVHTAVYYYLKTNLPKQLMEINGFPMDDYPAFPDHRQVLQYINKLADTFNIRKYIKFNVDIKDVHPTNTSEPNTTWTISYENTKQPFDVHTEEFDIVIVCTGAYTTPIFPTVENEGDFQGLILHSSCYRRPEVFAGKVVAVLGAGFSGVDICFEVSIYAKKVYLCHQKQQLETRLPDNVNEKISTFKKYTSCSVILENGEELTIDAVIYCTGYKHDFAVLPKGMITVDKRARVNNLFMQIIFRHYSSIFLMGANPFSSPFFLLADQQALFIASVLEGSAKLPSQREIKAIIERESKKPEATKLWWEYLNELSEITDRCQSVPPALIKLWDRHFKVWDTHFDKCRTLSYKIIDRDNIIQL